MIQWTVVSDMWCCGRFERCQRLSGASDQFPRILHTSVCVSKSAIGAKERWLLHVDRIARNSVPTVRNTAKYPRAVKFSFKWLLCSPCRGFSGHALNNTCWKYDWNWAVWWHCVFCCLSWQLDLKKLHKLLPQRQVNFQSKCSCAFPLETVFISFLYLERHSKSSLSLSHEFYDLIELLLIYYSCTI